MKTHKLKALPAGIKWLEILFAIFITSGTSAAGIGFILQKYAATNLSPVAIIKVSAIQGPVPHKVVFDGTSSKDPEGKLLKYTWKIGNKTVAQEPYFTYVFEEVGTYHVRLKIEDPKGATSTGVVFIESIMPKKVKSVKEALKYYQYEVGWLGPAIHNFKYYKITDVEFKDSDCLKLKYSYKNGVSHYTLFEHEHKIYGNWIDADGRGVEELVFSKDFSVAKGWWSYDHNPSEKYKINFRSIK